MNREQFFRHADGLGGVAHDHHVLLFIGNQVARLEYGTQGRGSCFGFDIGQVKTTHCQ